jgi:hypothetical protein
VTILLVVSCARSPSPAAPLETESAQPPRVTNDEASRPASREAAVVPVPSPVRAAVVELFTSEGCSSCPPADENLARITEEAETSGRPVFTLELHVDYWDDLGWKDPFSSSTYSERQRAYAQSFGRSDVYTPQMIVNGREQFVGSERRTADDAIARGLAMEPSVGVVVTARTSDSDPSSVEVAYRVGGSGPLDLALAVLEDAAETEVTRGENARRRLRHRHVARAFAVLHVVGPSAGSWTAPWPASASEGHRTALAYVTSRASLAVLGAASTRVD